MAQVNILNLPVAISLDGTEWVPLQRVAGTTQRATVAQIGNLQFNLDLIGSAQGDVLFRGASEWQALAPGTAGYVLSTQGAGADPVWVTNTAGSVTSVGLALPSSVFTISGSPVTSSGTLTGSFATQTANTVFAGPATGSAATPTFRALAAADLPGTVLTWGS